MEKVDTTDRFLGFIGLDTTESGATSIRPGGANAGSVATERHLSVNYGEVCNGSPMLRAVLGSVWTRHEERCSMLRWGCSHVSWSNALADRPAVEDALQWHRVFSGQQVQPTGLA